MSEKPKNVIWDDARAAQARPPKDKPDLDIEPGDMAIGTSENRLLVVIRKDGRLEYGPDYTPDEAAQVFWEAMLRMKLEVDDRLLLIQHMEALLTRIGAQDLRTEALRKQAAEEPNPIRAGELRQYAELSIKQLESMVHQAIELGRGLARRPDVVPPAVPDEMPASLQNDAGSAYEGKAGLPEENVCGECGAIAPLGADLCLNCEAQHNIREAN